MPIVGMDLDNELLQISRLNKIVSEKFGYPGVGQVPLCDQDASIPLIYDHRLTGLRALKSEHVFSRMLEWLGSEDDRQVTTAREALVGMLREVRREAEAYFNDDFSEILTVALPFSYRPDRYGLVLDVLEEAGWPRGAVVTEPEAALLGHHLKRGVPLMGRILTVKAGLHEFTCCLWGGQADVTGASFELLAAETVDELSGRELAEAMTQDALAELTDLRIEGKSDRRLLRLWIEHAVLCNRLGSCVTAQDPPIAHLISGEGAPRALALLKKRGFTAERLHQSVQAGLQVFEDRVRSMCAAMETDAVDVVFVSGKHANLLKRAIAERVPGAPEVVCDGSTSVAADGAAYLAALRDPGNPFLNAFTYRALIGGSVGVGLEDGRFDRLLALEETGWWCHRNYEVQRNGQVDNVGVLEIRQGQYLTAADNQVVARIEVPMASVLRDGSVITVGLKLESSDKGVARVSTSKGEWHTDVEFSLAEDTAEAERRRIS